MSVFKKPVSPQELNQLDWTILRNGPIAKYHDPAFLRQDMDWFRGNDYMVHLFECSKWISEKDLHIEIEQTLHFPDYYGRNLDAFDECIVWDLAVPDIGGLVLVFSEYDQFAGRHPYAASVVLDCIASASRVFSLTGQRLIALVQLNVDVRFELVGGTPVSLNPREYSSRLAAVFRSKDSQYDG